MIRKSELKLKNLQKMANVLDQTDILNRTDTKQKSEKKRTNLSNFLTVNKNTDEKRNKDGSDLTGSFSFGPQSGIQTE